MRCFIAKINCENMVTSRKSVFYNKAREAANFFYNSKAKAGAFCGVLCFIKTQKNPFYVKRAGCRGITDAQCSIIQKNLYVAALARIA